MDKQKYILDMPPLVVDVGRRGTRGSVVMENLVSGYSVEYQLRLEKKMLAAMTLAHLKAAGKRIEDEIKRRKNSRT